MLSCARQEGERGGRLKVLDTTNFYSVCHLRGKHVTNIIQGGAFEISLDAYTSRTRAMPHKRKAFRREGKEQKQKHESDVKAAMSVIAPVVHPVPEP